MQVKLSYYGDFEVKNHGETFGHEKPEEIVFRGIDWLNLPLELKFNIFGYSLQILRNYRSQNKQIKYHTFIKELSQRLGGIVEEQMALYVDSLILNSYLKRDSTNVIDPCCKLVDEYFTTSKKALKII